LRAFLRSVLQLLVTVNGIANPLIRFTSMMEAVRSSEMSVLTGATRLHIRDYGILRSHPSENLKSYILTSFLKY
jgi:hypothetical protein